MSNGYRPGVREVRPGEDPPTGYTCSLPAGHEGEHEAWALPDGGTFDARAEHLSTWGGTTS